MFAFGVYFFYLQNCASSADVFKFISYCMYNDFPGPCIRVKMYLVHVVTEDIRVPLLAYLTESGEL